MTSTSDVSTNSMTALLVGDAPVVIVPSQGRGRSNSLPTSVVEVLKRWLLTHMNHPYPSDQEKAELCQQTGIDVKRLNNWFVNNRIRYWKPKMEALHQKDPKSRTPPPPTAAVGSAASSSTSTSRTASPKPSKAASPNLVGTGSRSSPSKSPKNKVSRTSSVPAIHSFSYSPSVISEESSSFVEDSDGDSDDATETVVDYRDCPSSSSRASPVHCLRMVESSALVTPITTSRRLSSKKRSLLLLESSSSSTELPFPRSKYSRKDEGLWRESCVTSSKINDMMLPTLDEAALLFGFATTNFDSSTEDN